MSYWDVFEIAPIFLIHLGLFLEFSIRNAFLLLLLLLLNAHIADQLIYVPASTQHVYKLMSHQ